MEGTEKGRGNTILGKSRDEGEEWKQEKKRKAETRQLEFHPRKAARVCP